jgi:hypothetical protein
VKLKNLKPMKQLLVTAALASITAGSAFGQGSVLFQNSSSTRVSYAVDGANINGSGFRIQLFYANGDVTSESALEAVPNRTPLSTVTVGIFAGGSPYILPSVSPAGGVATFQVRAWAAVLGETWDAASANWAANSGSDASRKSMVLGKSALFRVDTADPTASPLPPSPNLTAGVNGVGGLTGFTVDVIPEPSTIALGVFGGLSALLLFRRRK